MYEEFQRGHLEDSEIPTENYHRIVASSARLSYSSYRRAEQLVVDDAPILPVWHYTYERLFQPYVRNVEVNGLGDPYIPLRKIRLDRP